LVTSGSFAKCLLNQTQNFAGLGVPAEGRLREHQLAVYRHLEAAAGRRHQLERSQPDLMQLEELRRQTDGAVGIVSGRAVFDADDIHRKSLSGGEYTASPPAR